MGVSATDALEVGRAALARHAWNDAYEHLQVADAGNPLAPRDLERLAEAARWSRHFPEMLDALERAQGSYETDGKRRDAARLALELAYMHWERADDAIAGGWMARATRLLEDIEECAEHGRLRLGAAHILLRQGAVEASAEIAREVVDAGRRLGDRALEGLGLVNLGHAMIALEKVDEGLRLVDEASALAQTGSLDLDTTGSIFCSSIFACRNTADWQRAGEWTEASMRWCERNSVTGFPGLCRFHRAEVLRMRGALADAERDAREAIEELLGSAPRHVPFGFGELGEIQRRRGERDAAATSFRRCSELGGQPEPGLSLMLAAEGDAAGALRSLRETLNAGDALVRKPGVLLQTCVAVALAAGDIDAARESLAQLEAHAAQARTSPCSPRWTRRPVTSRSRRDECSSRSPRFGAGSPDTSRCTPPMRPHAPGCSSPEPLRRPGTRRPRDSSARPRKRRWKDWERPSGSSRGSPRRSLRPQRR